MTWILDLNPFLALLLFGLAAVLSMMLGLNLMGLLSFWARTKAWQRATGADSSPRRRSGE